MNLHTRLIVRCRREDFALLDRDSRVTVDELRANAAQSLDTQRQRSYIEQQYVFDIALQHAALDSCADCNTFIRIDTLVRSLVKEAFCSLLNCRHTAHTADHDDFINLAGRQVRVTQAVLARDCSAVEQVARKLLQFSAGEAHLQVLRTSRVCSDKRQVDVSICATGQLALCFFSRFLQALQRHRISLQVNAVSRFEFRCHPVDDDVIEVIATQVCITIGSHHFACAFAQVQDGDIECTATQVVNGNLLVLLLVHAVCQRCCSRLVDDTLDLQTCDTTGIFRCLTLAVVEVCRNRDDRVLNLLAEECLCVCLELLQNHCRDFRR